VSEEGGRETLKTIGKKKAEDIKNSNKSVRQKVIAGKALGGMGKRTLKKKKKDIKEQGHSTEADEFETEKRGQRDLTKRTYSGGEGIPHSFWEPAQQERAFAKERRKKKKKNEKKERRGGSPRQ